MSRYTRRSLTRNAMVGVALAAPLAVGATQSAAADSRDIHTAVRTMDNLQLMKSQTQRLYGRHTKSASDDLDLPDIDYSTLSCPSKCMFSCPD